MALANLLSKVGYLFGIDRRVNIGSLVVFRICFGLIAAFELLRSVALERVPKYYACSQMHFTYFGFEWIQPFCGYGTELLFILTAAMAVALALGWNYRLASVLFCMGFGYIFLIDKANYQNHFYLMLLLGLLLVMMPLNAAFSFDAKHRPIISTDSVAGWCLLLLRFQFAIIYLFSAMARTELVWSAEFPNLPPWVSTLLDRFYATILARPYDEQTLLTCSMLLAAIDFLIVFGLTWRPLRIPTVFGIIFVNLLHASFFDAGMQPWLHIACATLFLPPDWPHRYRRLWAAFDDRALPQMNERSFRLRRLVATSALAFYICFQLIIPLRHFAYPTESDWTGKSSRFSWSSTPSFENRRVEVFVESSLYFRRTHINLGHFLTDYQIRMLRVWPDLVHDFAFILRRKLKEDGHKHVQVFAEVSFKDESGQQILLTDPNSNLLLQPRRLLARLPWSQATPIYRNGHPL